MAATIASESPVKAIALWVLRVLVAALFLYAAFIKLTGDPKMVEEFAAVGLGQWFRYVAGLMELVGGIAVLVPAMSIFGAAVLLCVDVGAFVAQVAAIHMDWIHTIVIGAVLLVIIFLQRPARSVY